MASLENCPECGSLFVKNLRSVCDTCHQEVEKQFELVYSYIKKRDNRTATRMEVSENTGVAESLISRFIREGRLHLTHFPNMTYPCTSCGEEIRDGSLCRSCKENIKQGLEEDRKDRERKDRIKEREAGAYKTYHSFNAKQ
ncbi:TIGR03826 family flagellar region protein [Bacillus sp. FJAT-44742]|uniref:TIGR03826 family flagellar region protein n=1 Tax=Bacillus sp. FJAT-44742 TaxID=2014005 RepID=UPI000C23435C|nr:TIGR03826 family flagellar region protein [Bacillus sp. FJAT-44742]